LTPLNQAQWHTTDSPAAYVARSVSGVASLCSGTPIGRRLGTDGFYHALQALMAFGVMPIPAWIWLTALWERPTVAAHSERPVLDEIPL